MKRGDEQTRSAQLLRQLCLLLLTRACVRIFFNVRAGSAPARE